MTKKLRATIQILIIVIQLIFVKLPNYRIFKMIEIR